MILSILGFIYQKLFRPLIFRFDSETVHVAAVNLGEKMGKAELIRRGISSIIQTQDPLLSQKIAGIQFQTPIGLAAGFDYEAKLTQILPALGFGFETVGTITNMAYEGNPLPRLGRLPKSSSLMVNKGFKNLGAEKTIHNLSGLSFTTPIGISIGKTNIPSINTQKKAIADVVECFSKFEDSGLPTDYYELNISCPNLFGDVTFYPTKNLKELLSQVDKLKIKRPIFVKMPIIKSDAETMEMLDIISQHCPKGVVFGNLQKNRQHPKLHQEEVKKYSVGNFSGLPTFERSNQLIRLSYKNFQKRFVIIGCGGVFSANDAYEKITLGASLVELITGLVFRGPQLVAQINQDLVKLLRRDGFAHISQATGSNN